jgi:hypothetical protein
MSGAVYCGECGAVTMTKDNESVPRVHNVDCSLRFNKTRIKYGDAFGIKVPIEVDDDLSKEHYHRLLDSLAINYWRKANGVTEHLEEQTDINNRRADSGWLYVEQLTCGCGIDVSDISIENTVTSYTQDDSTKIVICMQWHRLCYVNALV